MKNASYIIDYVSPFLDYCEVEKGLSDNTQKNYRQYLLLFVNWLKIIGSERLRPQELTPQHIWDYRLYLARVYKTPRGKFLGKKSQNYYLIALRAFLNYFAERDIETLPSSKVKLAKQSSDRTVSFLEVHDVEKLLEVLDTSNEKGLRDRAILELLFSSGIRISELVSLNRNDVYFLRDNNKDKTHEIPIVGKGNRVRIVFVSPRAAHWLRKYMGARKDISKALFVNLRARDDMDNRLSARSIQYMIARCAMLAGLAKKVTPHTLRHTYATDLLAQGADLRSVQELLGHKNVATTQIYTHVTNKRLRDIYEKFHSGSLAHE